jgi:type IV pilus assembly protein PilN
MIKVNLLPFKRKKKQKPLPAFIIATVILTVFIGVIMAYLAFFFSTGLSQKKSQFAANERKIAELKEKIKAADEFEERNKMFKNRSDVIEQLGRNKSVPVKILSEVASLIPKGLWLQNMSVSGTNNISMDGYGFTNSEIVNYVENLKASPLFAEVYLQESKSVEKEKISVYMFKLTCKTKT